MVSLTNVPPTLKFEDGNAIATELPEITRIALLQNAFDIDIKAGDRTDTTAIFGVSTAWLSIRGDEALEGRLLSEEDVTSLDWSFFATLPSSSLSASALHSAATVWQQLICQ